MAQNPWSWRDGKNPYLSTPFQILDLQVDLVGRGAIESVIRRRRQRIQSNPERFPLFGEVLDVAKVNVAADAVREPVPRLYAELCTHQPHTAAPLDLADFSGRHGRVARVVADSRVTIDGARLARLVSPPQPRHFEVLLEW